MSKLDLTKLAQRIESLHHWVDTQQKNSQSSTETSTNTNLEVWHDALKELSTCQEALHQQYDQLEEERQWYKNLFDSAPDGHVVTDTAGVVRHANDAAAALLGKPPEWLVSKPLVLFVAQKERQQFHLQLKHFLTERRSHQWDVRLQPYSRPSFDASLIVAPLFDSAGTLSSLLWLLRDVSEQKWAKEELRKASHELAQRATERTAQLVTANEALRAEITSRQQMQAQLIENERLAVLGVTAEKVAHEIGNVLNNLSTTMQLQRSHINTHPSLRDAILMASVHDSQQQLQRLSESVHGWRSLAQQSRLHLEPTNLTVLITEELDSQARRYNDQGVTVVRDLPDDLPQVEVDREKLQRALHNVCTNALNAMPAGGTLTVRLSRVEEYVIIEVRNTGQSLPEGVDLFDLFTTALPPRVGLGLAIADQIISAHSGKMTYESDPDTGTIVRLTLLMER